MRPIGSWSSSRMDFFSLEVERSTTDAPRICKRRRYTSGAQGERVLAKIFIRWAINFASDCNEFKSSVFVCALLNGSHSRGGYRLVHLFSPIHRTWTEYEVVRSWITLPAYLASPLVIIEMTNKTFYTRPIIHCGHGRGM